MLARAIEKGLASVIARWMLEGHADAVLDRVAAAGALAPEEIDALRGQTRERLRKVRDDGAPYAALLEEALGAIASRAGGPMAETLGALRPTAEAVVRSAVAKVRAQATGASRDEDGGPA